jgi:hypothetical protein
VMIFHLSLAENSPIFKSLSVNLSYSFVFKVCEYVTSLIICSFDVYLHLSLKGGIFPFVIPEILSFLTINRYL